MKLDDPVVIFGGVDGIGGQLARRLSAAGCRIALTSRSMEKARTFAEDIGAVPLVADVLDEESIAAAIARAAPDGRLGGLVYAVGSILLKPLARVSTTDLMDAYRLNVVGAALAVKHSAPALKTSGGSVVLFSSVAAAQGFPNHAIIGSSKAAVSGLVFALAAELAPQVRVNAIAPSLTRTPLAVSLIGSAKMAEAIAELHPLKRLGEAEDSAALAAFLLSPVAAWITGQVIGVDGGRSTLRVGKG